MACLIGILRQRRIPNVVTNPGSYTFVAALLAMIMAAAPPAAACPGALFGLELSPPIVGPRNGVRLFVKDGQGQPPGVQEIAVQVDPVDDDGHLRFFDNETFRQKVVESSDFMTFRVESFGQKIDIKKDKLPCRGDTVYELWDDVAGRYAYLTNCGPTAIQPKLPSAVAFDHIEHRLESDNYRYRFNPDNYMQFDEISFRNAQGTYDVIAKNSKLMIRADVKNFFTMNFDSDEILSQMEAQRLGPVGNLARLSFFLKIFLFKIRMSLATDVGFFADSGHIPMMVSLPINAYDHLHPKSGILYSWELSAAGSKAAKTVDMPLLEPSDVAKGYKELGKLGTKFCKGSECQFRYQVEVAGRKLAMDLGVKRSLVQRGFYPIYVEDLETYRETMGWDMTAEEAKGRVGMYFEVSGLPKGGHPWDFWMRLGGPSQTLRRCPAWIRIGTVH